MSGPDDAGSKSQREAPLLAALRGGDESAFSAFVAQNHAALVRLATHYVASRAVAEEVAQEAWVVFVQSLSRFEGRSTLRTWLFGTLLNCARNRKRSEVRSVPFSALFEPDDHEGPTVDPARFRPDGVWAGHWAVAPREFALDGERRLLGDELRALLQRAIDALPPAQREVITLRDMHDLDAEEVCEVLGLSEANQRVLLHRARAKVRAAIEADREAQA